MVSIAKSQTTLAFVSLCLLIATAVSSSQSKALTLWVLLPIISVFSATSACLEQRLSNNNTTPDNKHSEDGTLLGLAEKGLRPTGLSVILILAPSLSLCLLLLVRLLFIDHFMTDPAALDFGPKHGNPDETNIAFGPSFSSFGHWIQGAMATLLAYPAVGGLLARGCRCCNKNQPLVLAPPQSWVLWLADVCSFTLTVYPVYNFIKRIIKSPETFATSSYMNNGCEWAMGALLGVSLGMLITSLTKRKLFGALKETNDVGNGIGNSMNLHPFSSMGVDASNDEQQRPGFLASLCPGLCQGVARLVGALFFISVFGAAAMTGITWNSCEDGAEDCSNFDVVQGPVEVIVGLVLIPALVSLFALIVIVRRRSE